MSKRFFMFAAAAAFAMGCGGDEEPLPNVDCGVVTTPTYAQVTGFAKCNVCHSSTAAARNDAPVGVDFDTYEAAAAHAEEAAAEVFNGKMPPAGFEAIALTEEEADALYQWALCGAPQ